MKIEHMELVRELKPRKQRRRTLPVPSERFGVTANLDSSVRFVLHIVSYRTRRTENQIARDALQFLMQRPIQDYKLPPHNAQGQPIRTSFFFDRQFINSFSGFVNGSTWTKTAAVNLAMVLYFESMGVNAYTDPTKVWKSICF